MKNTFKTNFIAYKFRAECMNDVYVFIDKLGRHSNLALSEYKVKPVFVKGLRLPDCVVEFKSNLTLEEIIKIMQKIVDGHVMLQTVELKENYTGERKERYLPEGVK